MVPLWIVNLYWCDCAFLLLNVTKTKDMSFRHQPSNSQSTIIKGQVVDFVKNYKYLGMIINYYLPDDYVPDDGCLYYG